MLQQVRMEPPVFPHDLFADDALRDPAPLYRALRDTAPVVRLPAHDLYAIGRFKDVQAALRAPEVLISGRGTGFNHLVNAPKVIQPTIESDGERHRRLRGLLNRALMPKMLVEHRPLMEELIARRVDELADGRWFDGVRELASCLPLEVVAQLVGLPPVDKAKMLRWGAAAFNAVGPLVEHGPAGERLRVDFATLAEVRLFFETIDPDVLDPDSWTGRLFGQVKEGLLDETDARAAMSGFVLPSLDTTISASSWLLYNLGRFPEEWRKLQDHPELVRSAVLEGMRYNSVARWFSRFAVDEYPVEDHLIPKGARVMIMYQCANWDERKFPNPETFDVVRNPVDHVGWGSGPHMCAGMHLAKIEMDALLSALLARISRIEVGTPVLSLNRGLYSIERLPMRLLPAQQAGGRS